MLTYRRRRWHRRVGNAPRTCAFGCSHICKREHFAMQRLRVRGDDGKKWRERRMRLVNRPAGERNVENARFTPSHTDANGVQMAETGFFYSSFPLFILFLLNIASSGFWQLEFFFEQPLSFLKLSMKVNTYIREWKDYSVTFFDEFWNALKIPRFSTIRWSSEREAL